ncbi:MAG: hypothetical protein ACOX8V_07040, partial [Thermoleophilia bacterium]
MNHRRSSITVILIVVALLVLGTLGVGIANAVAKSPSKPHPKKNPAAAQLVTTTTTSIPATTTIPASNPISPHTQLTKQQNDFTIVRFDAALHLPMFVSQSLDTPDETVTRAV